MANQSSATKRPLGDGFQLVTLAAGGPYPLRLDAPFQQATWTQRRPVKPDQPIYPGSALMIDGRWYEILDLEMPSGLPRRFSYFLAPWEERFPLRQAYELTPEYLADLAAAERAREQRLREAGVLRFIPFLLGLLPAEDQEEIESTYGLSGNRNTLLTAGLLLGFCTFVLMLTFAYKRGLSFGDTAPVVKNIVAWAPLALYLGVESVARWAYAMTSREAIGSLPVALPILIARALVNTFSSESRTRKSVAREFRAPPQEIATARDTVRRLADGRLEVLSRLPKKHWTQNVTGIRFRGEVYYLDVREVVNTSEGTRHRFEIVRPEREILWKEMLEYHPEEVRNIYREERRLQAAIWVESFAFLWGFLDQDTQVRIEKGYHYEPWNKTRWSLYFAVALSLWWFLDGIAALQGENPGLLNGLSLVFAIYLLWETFIRRQHLVQGEIRGSLLGWFLKPLVVPFLQWGPKPVVLGATQEGVEQDGENEGENSAENSY